MDSGCLANTGDNQLIIYFLIVILFVVGISLLLPYKKRYLIISLFFTFSFFSFSLANTQQASAQSSCTVATSTPRVWTPSGRFQNSVFSGEDINTQTNVVFGSETNFSGNPENLLMTINQPSQTVDTEVNRPLVIAFPGGGSGGGFCDETFTTEQTAMLELTQLGYVTATVHQLLDPTFCGGGGATATDYRDNMLINLSVINKAIQYMYDNAPTYSIDPNNTALYGYSIGGQISLVKLRSSHSGVPHVKVLAGFASVTTLDDFDTWFSPLVSAGPNSPSIMMVSYEPDNGYGPGIDPDPRGDCANLVSLGYDCIFGGLDYEAHAVHANSVAPNIITGTSTPVNLYFQNYLYEKMILN